MKTSIIENIEKEMERLIEELGKVDPSSEDYKEIIGRLNSLYETVNKEDELQLKDKVSAKESLAKLEELRQSKVFNGVKIGVEIFAAVAPLVFYGVWMKRGLEFEKEGSFTSTTFKGLFGKFKPTK